MNLKLCISLQYQCVTIDNVYSAVILYACSFCFIRFIHRIVSQPESLEEPCSISSGCKVFEQKRADSLDVGTLLFTRGGLSVRLGHYITSTKSFAS